MNRDQLRYARERLENVRDLKLSDIRADCTKMPDKLNAKKLTDLIKSGKIKAVDDEDGEISAYTNLRSVFQGIDPYLKSSTFDKKRFESRKGKVMAEYTRIMDHLILGDASEAVKMIDTFTTKAF